MPILLLIFIAAMLSPAATLTITPAFNADCGLGLDTATLTWSGATGPVQIRVGPSPGIVMTDFGGTSGSTQTGFWVSEGLMFYLVDQIGTVQASATAHLSCGGTPRTIDQGLSGGSYFPLAIGNTWIYKYNSRVITNDYTVQSITDTQVIDGQTYYVLTLVSPGPGTTVALLRTGSNGVIYQNTKGTDQVYFDPNASTVQKIAYSGPLGSFNDALKLAPPNSIETTTSIYVRGIGLVNSQSISETGSSGGFVDGLDLIDVRVDGIHLSVPAPKIGLSIENTDLDLTNKLAPNCAVPCYFPACGFGPSYDPPGVYRPCTQARIDTSATSGGYTVLLQLLDSTGTVIFTTSPSPGLDYVRVALYAQPVGSAQFTLLPPGDYKLLGSILNGGTTQATSSITVHIH